MITTRPLTSKRLPSILPPCPRCSMVMKPETLRAISYAHLYS
jgi:uncharacterized C2H2 Zn-finger protein